MPTRNLVFFALASLAGACATEDAPVDELAGESPVLDGEQATAPPGADAFTYVVLLPAGSGLVAERINRSQLACADGSWAERCPVASIDWSAAQLAAADEATAAASVGSYRAIVRGDLGVGAVLTAREVWLAGGADVGAPEDVVVRVQDADIRCITAPCESLTEQKLNSLREGLIAELDFAAVAGAADVDLARAAMAGDGVIVAGWRIAVEGPAGSARGRAVSRSWTRLGR
jgi:hypothetical protein